MRKSTKVLGAVALAAVIGSPAVLANPRFSAVFSSITTLSTGTQFVPGDGAPAPVRVGSRAALFAFLGRPDPASPS